MENAPAPKRQRTDGNIDAVDKSVLAAAQDHEAWIAERKKNWPSAQRIATKLAEEASKPKNATIDSSSGPPQTQSKPKRQMCRYFLKGRCTSGAQCRFSHEKSIKTDNRIQEKVYSRFEAPTKASLFVKLVQSDHDIEDERLLEFIEFLHNNNLLH